MPDVRLLLGDCLESLRGLPDASVEACVTDPPYGLSFMGKGWDHAVPSVEVWREVLRVLKPGAHLLSFFGTRTYHRGVVAIEDAGFEIRDQIGWAYGSGFPKSHDVSKAIDAAAGAVRELTRPGKVKRDGYGEDWDTGSSNTRPRYDKSVTNDAQRWQGWGTALKPAWEPIVVARKPLIGTVAANVLAWGTGVINVDGCRVGHDEACRVMAPSQANIDSPSEKCRQAGRRTEVLELKPEGRWPANFIHDGSDEVVGLFPGEGDTSAARFFYCAKASKADREDGLEGFEAERHADRQVDDGPGGDNPRNRTNQPRRNHHPTVKPTDLMRYLCRLVTPPGGVVLDPFMGSGSTGRGAVLEGFGFIGCELTPAYLEIARARIAAVSPQAEESSGQLPLF